MHKIVVTGGSGTLATALREFLPNAKYLTRADCDVRDPTQISAALWNADPEVVIHAAALTDHQYPNAAEVIESNIFGTEHVARWCRTNAVKVVYLSTHYVYPGARGNYAEHNTPRPIGTYAWSKLAGERWAETVPEHLIVRGSWYTFRRVALWAKMGAVADAYGSREPVTDAARKIAALVQHGALGTFNIGGPRRTYYDIAVECFGDGHVTRATRADIVAPYAFPVDASVSTAKFDALGLPL